MFPSLKGRLVFWFTAICLVPMALMTSIIYLQRLKTSKERIFDKLSAVSALRQQQINATLDNMARDVATLAVAHAVVESAAALLAHRVPAAGTGAEAVALLQGYRDHLDAVAEVAIVSRTGTVLLSTSEGRRGSSVARPETVASTLRDLVPTFGEAYNCASDGVPSIEVAAPLGSAAKGRLAAVLLIRYNIRKLLYDLVENNAGMGQTGETLLVNREVVALTDLRGLPGSILKAKLKGRPAQLAAQGQSGISQSADYLGKEVLAAYAYIPRTGWGLVCKQDSKEVFAPVVTLLWVTYGLGLLLSLLVCGFAFRLASSLSRPIRNLSRAAREIGGGDYDARIVPEGSQEHRDVALSFNAMADALQLRMDAQHGLALISENLVMASFFAKLLPVLMQFTGAKMAVAFMEDDQGDYFSPVHSIGADASQMRKYSREKLEGELGTVISSRQVSHFTTADAQQALRFVTSFGEVLPAEIITVPIFVDDEIRAFVSLAAVKPFPAKAHDTLQQAMFPISAAFARVLAGDYVRKLAGELAAKNAELTQQSEELVQQSSELAHQSEELSRHNRILDLQKQQLEQATRLKSEFLSNMSHELRTPLNSVLALSRVLAVQSGERLSEDERGYLTIIERNGKHLLSLINDILDLAKIESGRQDVFYDHVSLEKVVTEVVDGLTPLATEKGISLSLLPHEPLPPATIDARKLRQILHNIVGNAVKFTVQGSVSIEVRVEAEELAVEVIDTGIGIAPEELENIFQEFRQADGSSSRCFEGTGLGLAIARKTARLLGGEVSAASVPGKGSTFSLRLPLDGRHKSSGESRPAPIEQCGAPAPARSVLVVDDDPQALTLIASHLGGAGYRTMTATNGLDALRIARAEHPFAITLDIVMPEMDGWQVMRALKEDPETAGIPVVIVSLSENRETGIALGAIGVISKPVDAAQLLEQFSKLTGMGCRLALVVDDNEQDRFFIASLLKENGIDVLLAESGQEAIELAMEGHPDLITLDLVMPGMDGAAVLDRLRACESTARIPVVVITSKDLTGAELTRLSSGVSAILSKGGHDRELMLEELVKNLGRLGWSLPQAPSSRGSRILIVEDSEAATIQLRFALDSEGISVDAVSGGRHALQYLKTHVPDGIILDLMMPEVDGFQVLQAVRQSPLTRQVPVLVMTAKSLSPGEHDRLRELEVRHLLQKGDVDQQELIRRVYEMLGVERLFQQPQAATLDKRVLPPKGERQGDGSLLVVEDNPDNLATIRAVLGKEYRIVEAADGEAGLAAARAGSPSLILLDMQLPRMDGMTVLKNLQEHHATAGIPVLALTASAMAGDRDRFLQAGCADYLSKPFQVEELLAKVRMFVGE
jgi:CheY-like chemotaxis protein/HAMP domain-containing protein